MLTLQSMLRRAARHYPERLAAIYESPDPDPAGVTELVDWRELGERAARGARVLAELGLGPGTRFAVLSRNRALQAELLWAGYWAGVTPVPLNFRLAPGELDAILDDARPGALVCERHFAALGEGLAERAGLPRLWLDGPAGAGRGAEEPSYEGLREAATPAPPAGVGESDDAIVLYTGGTTGLPKGVRLSHGAVAANALQLQGTFEPRETDRFLHVAPMFHSADLLANTFTLMGGGHAWLGEWSPGAFLAAVERHRITVTMLPPTLIVLLLKEGGLERHDLSSLRRIYYGASPMAPEWIARAVEALPGVELHQSYGLTESAPILSTLGWADHARALAGEHPERLRSAGRPLPATELAIVDEQGQELGPGQGGEVLARGPQLMSGYLDRPDATAAALAGGWLHTGDVGMIDEDGYLFLLDRKKDVIITGGENVYSSEVEAVLYRHPDVHEAAVVGVAHEVWGEAVVAVVVPAPGSRPDPVRLEAHCRQSLGGYKVPKRILVEEALPKSAMGKILKNVLRERLGEERERLFPEEGGR